MLPQHILDEFARIPHDTPIKNKYYGVFNMILTQVCFADVNFIVIPQYPLAEAGVPPTIDFVVIYVVQVGGRPVFFLEIIPLSISAKFLAESTQTSK